MIRRFPSTVVRVIDGDTIDADCDLGFRTWVRMRFRLTGVDAEEPGTVLGARASEWLRDRLEGKDVIIESTKLDKYGRFLARVFVDSDLPVNDEMLRLGLAERYTGGKRRSGG